MTINSIIGQEIDQLLRYADLVARKGYVCNQLGNIAIRSSQPVENDSLILTKPRGISLEEMNREDVVGVGLQNTNLVFGDRLPSVGHALSREIFLQRPDVNATIHVHVDELIAYFSIHHERKFDFISADAAIILGAPAKVFPPELNVEVDASLASSSLGSTNVLILANHGITTFGSTVSHAYHRLNTMVAEVRRLIFAKQITDNTDHNIAYLNNSEVEEMYALGRKIL